MQLYRYVVSQYSEFCHNNIFCCFSTSNTKGNRIFRYRLSPETFEYTLVDSRIGYVSITGPLCVKNLLTHPYNLKSVTGCVPVVCFSPQFHFISFYFCYEWIVLLVFHYKLLSYPTPINAKVSRSIWSKTDSSSQSLYIACSVTNLLLSINTPTTGLSWLVMGQIFLH
jgi:hypothetical protein